MIDIVPRMSMQEPTFYVLTVLAGPPLHGYGIMRAIDELSGGGVSVRPGTLYAALDRLTHAGLVEVAREETSEGGRLRRFYQLTADGGAALRAEADRRTRLASVAVQRLSTLLPRTS
jgi:DNA-binding PadR family transcriptional regulator